MIAKWEDNVTLDPTGDFYDLTEYAGRVSCDCPAGNKPECRHRKMYSEFVNKGIINDPRWFYDYDKNQWLFLHEEGGMMNEVGGIE